MSKRPNTPERELNVCSDTFFQNFPLELTTKPSIYQSGNICTNIPIPPKEYSHIKMVVENEPSKYTYPIQVTKPFERESWTVSKDHCYARPWNWRPETKFLKPAKTLFIPKNFNLKLFRVSGSPKIVDDEIDVELEVESPTPIYDASSANSLMDVCDRHAALSRNNSCGENWEEKISKISWMPLQHRLFNGFVNILNSLYLSKTSQSEIINEPILRRTVVDKAVQRVRRLFATVSFDQKLLQWLHQLSIDNLDQQYLSLYLDILQTLKSKIPYFVEKMLYNTNSGGRLGPLNNENLFPLLRKPWDPVLVSLMQDKPKKLPGNPVIVLIPCSPSMSKRNQKWMSLLLHLGHTLSVPTNFGSASHRMTMTNCIDQMFALTRGRVQEVRENYPGRHIILVGVGAGATLALQVAQVESVLCVVSLAFSLLTAEGRRGEPDDSLLELQCPALFVIGQCSSTSLHEDVEDLRERMRVETGLIVVGSADNNLIVNKKKKTEEGITQNIVDRSIIDEVGEFISSLILSPFPPQIRQSPTTIPPEAVTKKGKVERKRFNSNTSSIESEPPSPTLKITRPAGRPPGKSKSKLEVKWAAQVAQGTSSRFTTTNSVPPVPSNTPPPLIAKSDFKAASTSSSDTASVSESPIPLLKNPKSQKPDEFQLSYFKNIKTLKPVVIDEVTEKTGHKAAPQLLGGEKARIQAFNIGRNVIPGGQLSTLLQGGIKTIPPVHLKPPGPPSTIKVLENVQLSSQATAKLISTNSGRTIDISKLSLTGQRATGSNVVLLPDGKIKTVNSGDTVTMKEASGTSFMVSMNTEKILGKKRSKYISSKRFQTVKPPRPVKRHTYLPVPPTIQTNLPPPTNLTTQDIMSLPIIFADDNQLLDPNMPTDLSTTNTQQVTKFVPPTSTNKFVIVTKPASTSGNFIVTPTTVKRPAPVPVVKPPAKYTKIILSKKSADLSVSKLEQNQVALTNVTVMEAIDLENELVATAVPKPNLATSNVKNITILTKKEIHEKCNLADQLSVDDDDPDYVPPKNLKLK